MANPRMYQTGKKFLALIVVMVVLESQLSLVMAESADSRFGECITKTVDYLSEVQIDDSIKVMMNESRKFYPDIRYLLKAKVPHEYIESISKIRHPEGCNKLIAYYENIGAEVPCNKEFGNDDEFNEHVMDAGQKTRDVYEACFLCQLTDNVLGLAQ